MKWFKDLKMWKQIFAGVMIVVFLSAGGLLVSSYVEKDTNIKKIPAMEQRIYKLEFNDSTQEVHITEVSKSLQKQFEANRDSTNIKLDKMIEVMEDVVEAVDDNRIAIKELCKNTKGMDKILLYLKDIKTRETTDNNYN